MKASVLPSGVDLDPTTVPVSLMAKPWVMPDPPSDPMSTAEYNTWSAFAVETAHESANIAKSPLRASPLLKTLSLF
jgi:hypothetical protein